MINCEHSLYKRSGWTSNNKQRFRCSACGSTFIKDKSVNRLPEHRVRQVVSLLHKGRSLRFIEAALRLNKGTVLRYRKVFGIKPPAIKESLRKRDDYLKAYWKRQTMNQYQKMQWRDKCRGSIALWLAKNKKALSADQIYAAIHPQFPELSMNSLLQFLNVNCEGFFKKVKGNKWIFKPTQWHIPHDLNSTKSPEREMARRLYLQLRGKRDVNLEAMEKCWLSDKKVVEKEIFNRALKRSIPAIRMLATTAAIASTPINNESNNTKR